MLRGGVGMVAAVVIGCGGADAPLAVDALTARDLLGLSPEATLDWSEDERRAALGTLELASAVPDAEELPLGEHSALAATLLDSLAAADHERRSRGADALILTRAERADDRVILYSFPIGGAGVTEASAPAARLVAVGWDAAADEGWDPLVERAPRALVALAAEAGFDGERLFVSPAPQAPVAALYLPREQQLWVNPVLLAALPAESETARRVERAAGPSPALAGPVKVAPATDNPYSFYGSIGECAAALRLDCESCPDCAPRTRDADSREAECAALAEQNGIGYYLLCANLAAAIATVAECIEDRAPSCPVNDDAGALLSALSANSGLVDDPSCLAATDGCLESIYGDPDESFPGPPDPDDTDPPPPPPQPRSVDVGCGESSANCDFDPEIGSCSAGSCAAAPSCGGCDTSCEGGSCDPSCDSSGCAGCGDDSGGTDGPSCDGCSSQSDGCSSGGGCDGGGCEGGGCGSSCGGGECSGECSAAGGARMSGFAMAALWGFLPLPMFEHLRRRERRRRRGRGER